MPTAQDVLNAARSLLGIGETPPRSNIAHPITDWARQYGYSTGDAWCAWTVSYEVWHVDPALLDGMAPTGYSGAFRAWGEKYGRLISNPVPGAIDVMNFDADPSFTDHVGIVESVHSGYWTCIEGNHKDQVAREDRSFADGQHWFVLPKYSTAPQPKPKPKEDDGMYYSGAPYASADGKSFTFPDCYNKKHVYCLHTFGTSENVVFHLVSENGKVKHDSVAQNVTGHQLHFMDIIAAQKPIVGSFELRATSDTAIKWGLREELR